MAHNLNKRFSSRREKTPSYFTFMFVGFTLFGIVNDPTLCVCIFIALSIDLNIYVFQHSPGDQRRGLPWPRKRFI